MTNEEPSTAITVHHQRRSLLMGLRSARPRIRLRRLMLRALEQAGGVLVVSVVVVHDRGDKTDTNAETA